MLKDRFDRTVNYMRISLTDRCNLQCRYCMPDRIVCTPEKELLSLEEIAFICRQAVDLGIDRFKLTGGEPLVRRNCAALIRMLREIPGLSQVTLTTNGVLLEEQLEDLLDAGLDAVNVSLDTMDRAQYQAITGRDELRRVLSSIYAAAGRLPVKVNCVVLSGFNEDAPLQLAMLAKELPVDVRFIEMMPVGAGKELYTVPNASILDMIEKRFGETKTEESIHGNGPAVYRRPEGFIGSIGFISAVHGKFCKSCNRLRLTSTGNLKPCLCYGDMIPLKEILRDDMPARGDRIREKIRKAVLLKPRAHCFESRADVTENRKMVQIGG